MKQESGVLRAIVFEEEIKDAKMFVAQCLEKDICVQGKDMEELFKRLTATICLETPHMGDISPAPGRFFEMWKNGEALARHDSPEVPIAARKLVAR